MNGMAAAEKFYETAGKQMIRAKFPEYESRIAAGLSGQGSDCAGFDDEVSKDHDLEAGFCLWISEEDQKAIGFPLMRAYTKLSREYNGSSSSGHVSFLTGKYGVMTIGDFFRHQTGCPSVPGTWQEWFAVPEYAMFTATNGKVFRDDLGKFTAIRNGLRENYPADVRNKKLAAHLALAAQSGQYNFPRCLKHGEKGAAVLTLSEFSSHVLSALFELSGQFAPFYKWRFRAARMLPGFSMTAEQLENLLTDKSLTDPGKKSLVEMIAAEVTRCLIERGLSSLPGEYYLEAQALQVMKQIRNSEISSLHIMEYGE